MPTKSNSFRCKHCGECFALNKEDFKLYLDGVFMEPPSTCDECLQNPETRFDDLQFSDADPGL